MAERNILLTLQAIDGQIEVSGTVGGFIAALPNRSVSATADGFSEYMRRPATDYLDKQTLRVMHEVLDSFALGANKKLIAFRNAEDSLTEAQEIINDQGGGNPNPGQPTYFEYTPVVASTTWTIPHNLNKFPSVTVVDTLGEQVYAEVRYIDRNIVQVSFALPFMGKAFLN